MAVGRPGWPGAGGLPRSSRSTPSSRRISVRPARRGCRRSPVAARAWGLALMWAFVIEGIIPMLTHQPGIIRWLPEAAAKRPCCTAPSPAAHHPVRRHGARGPRPATQPCWPGAGRRPPHRPARKSETTTGLTSRRKGRSGPSARSPAADSPGPPSPSPYAGLGVQGRAVATRSCPGRLETSQHNRKDQAGTGARQP